MTAVLPHQLPFSPAHDAEFFAQLPASPAVFLLRGDAGEPYVSKSANLRRRLIRLLGAPTEATKRLNLRDRVTHAEFALSGSDFESGFLLYRTLRAAFPDTYRERLRLRAAPLIKLHLENEYPRAYVTTRISSLKGKSLYYGPFPTRAAAEKFLNDSLDFYKIRRCDFDLNPDPAFPGCIYSEMKMCLAPCFKGCTDEAYHEEVARVHRYLDTGGQALVREISTERDRASEAMEFEQAAALHARIEKALAVVRELPELVRRVDELRAVMVQPSAEAGAVTLFPIDDGHIGAPLTFRVQPSGGLHEQAMDMKQSMEARILSCLATAEPHKATSAPELMEHLAMLKRWFYRTSKTGELFLADEHGELPMRRLVRGVSRVFRGEKPQADLSESARDYWLNRAKETET